MHDPLQFLWPGIEAVNPVFSRAAIARWPSGVLEQLIAARLLVLRGTTCRVRCPECGEAHIVEPVARQQRDGTFRFFIPCPQYLRAEVKERDLQQWAVGVEALVGSLATSLGLGGKVTRLETDRVWRCGRWTYQGVLRDVLFARGLRRKDALRFRRAITGSRRPVVFVGSEIPDPDFWQGRIPPFIRLCEVASLAGGDIEIDATQVIGLIRAVDDEADDDTSVSRDQLKLIVRQQVKAEAKTSLSDDIFVAAYRHSGSLRKAAEVLSQQTEQAISKDKVQRAVNRAGGSDAVLRRGDSESIVRSVSSQRRDTPIEKRKTRKR